tara:strand:+ start:432 stop:575 length:144 start_codon:yes stop_codon:yes gene_type:complete
MEKRFIFSGKLLKWIEIFEDDRDWDSGYTINQLKKQLQQLKQISGVL